MTETAKPRSEHGLSCSFRTTWGGATGCATFFCLLNAFNDVLKNFGSIGRFLRGMARMLLCLFGGFPCFFESEFFAVRRSLRGIRLTLRCVRFGLCFRRAQLRALCQGNQMDRFHSRRVIPA